MNTITMAYGREGLAVRLDPSWQVEVVRKPAMPLPADPAAAVAAALAAPVGSPPLAAELAAAVAASGDRALAVIPEGPYVIPVFPG
jgi:hypothetical protein